MSTEDDSKGIASAVDCQPHNPLLAAALRYASRGIPVFPVALGAKKPHIKRGSLTRRPIRHRSKRGGHAGQQRTSAG